MEQPKKDPFEEVVGRWSEIKPILDEGGPKKKSVQDLEKLDLSDTEIVHSLFRYFGPDENDWMERALLDAGWSEERYIQAQKESGKGDSRVEDLREKFTKTAKLIELGR